MLELIKSPNWLMDGLVCKGIFSSPFFPTCIQHKPSQGKIPESTRTSSMAEHLGEGKDGREF